MALSSKLQSQLNYSLLHDYLVHHAIQLVEKPIQVKYIQLIQLLLVS